MTEQMQEPVFDSVEVRQCDCGNSFMFINDGKHRNRTRCAKCSAAKGRYRCTFCGKVIPKDEKFCSIKCEVEYGKVPIEYVMFEDTAEELTVSVGTFLPEDNDVAYLRTEYYDMVPPSIMHLVKELRDNLSRILREVERGKVIRVLRHGKDVVQLRPIEMSPEQELIDRLRQLHLLEGGTGRIGPVKTVRNRKPRKPVSDFVGEDRR